MSACLETISVPNSLAHSATMPFPGFQNVAPHMVGPHSVATQMIGSTDGTTRENWDLELVRAALRP